MLKDLTDIAPKAVVAAVALWGAANYLLIGPEVAARIVRADYIPACEKGYQDTALAGAEADAASLPPPAIDPAREMAAARLRRLRDSPTMRQLRQMSGGMGSLFGLDEQTDDALRQYEKQKQAAVRAYNDALTQIKRKTASNLGKSGTICGCVADAAIAETRREWAVFSASLGLIRPAPLGSFDERMARIRQGRQCEGASHERG